jgi:methyl-accepting chemotaxis protein
MLGKVFNSVTGKLLAVIALGTTLFVGAALFALSRTWTAVTDYQVLQTEVVSEMKDSLDLQNRLALQTQAWKNYLIRGTDPAARQRYGEALTAAEEGVRRNIEQLRTQFDDAEVNAAIDRFEAAHQDLVGELEHGRQQLAANGFDSQATDASLEGATRPTREALAQLITVIEQRAAAKATETREGARSALMLGIGIMAVGLIVAAVLLIWLLRRTVTVPLQQVDADLQRMAKGDFSEPVPPGADDEVGRLAASAERLRVDMGATLGHLRDAAAQVATAAEELSTVSTETQRGVDQQRSDTDQVATAMNEMATTVMEVARNASQSAETARAVSEDTERGRHTVSANAEAVSAVADAMGEAAGVISDLDRQAADIGEVIDVITGIAGQTNLLALNAAIEAARAGESGRGFSVVAEEVRSLAQKTQQSTDRIEAIVQKVQEGSGAAVRAIESSRERALNAQERAEEARGALESIGAGVGQIADLTAQIATATEEQSSVSDEINRNVSNISEVASTSAASVSQVTSAGRELSQLAGELQEISRRFVV